MKYQIKSGSELYEKLSAIADEANRVKKMCSDLSKELGALAHVVNTSFLAGRIVGFIMNEKPEGWKTVLSNKYSGACCYPKKIKVNKELIQRIESIPTVGKDGIKDALNYGEYTNHKECKWSSCPGLSFKIWMGVILVDVPEWAEYEPVEGMEEITVSQWRELKESKKQTVS